jgi:high-affinity Fe2+/Pb2+ permease
MKINTTAHGWRTCRSWSTACGASRASFFGLTGWLLFLSANASGWRAVSLVAVLALAVLAGIIWYAYRARADRRWRAALDRYAEQEEAKWTYSRKGHRR